MRELEALMFEGEIAAAYHHLEQLYQYMMQLGTKEQMNEIIEVLNDYLDDFTALDRRKAR